MQTIKALKDAYPLARSFVELDAICPHCQHPAQFMQFQSCMLNGRLKAEAHRAHKCGVHLGRCERCMGIVIGTSEENETAVLWPQEPRPAKSPPRIDEHSRADYLEAVATLPHSPQCSALLARRSLFRILRTELKVKWSKLAFQMEEAAEHKRISPETAHALRYLIRHEIVGPHLSRDPAKKRKPDPALHLLPISRRDAARMLAVLEMVIHDLYEVDDAEERPIQTPIETPIETDSETDSETDKTPKAEPVTIEAKPFYTAA